MKITANFGKEGYQILTSTIKQKPTKVVYNSTQVTSKQSNEEIQTKT